MERLDILKLETANDEAKLVLNDLKEKMGKVINIFGIMANSPVTLSSFLAFKENMGKGELTAKEAEIIALVLGEMNDCKYCLAAHTAMIKMQGISEEESLEYRKLKSEDNKTQTLITLVKEIVEKKGFIENETLDSFLSAGYSKSAVVEVLGHIGLNIFTNYFNHVVDTPLDFPEAKSI